MKRASNTRTHLIRFGLSLALCLLAGGALVIGAITAILRSTP